MSTSALALMPDRPKACDDENLYLAGDTGRVDSINRDFYSSFPYPWRPQNFLYPADGKLTGVALSQTVGDWEHRRLPVRPEIWVAGCGTNQAAQVALQYPLARIVASDLSAPSLELCAQTLRSMGLRNVELRQESLNTVPYEASFDLVIATGVIHHNSDPAAALARLKRALKPAGILELMVYNRFHRVMNTAIQKAIRLFDENHLSPWAEQMDLLERMSKALPPESQAALHFEQFRGEPAARIADSLLQPVEHNYTVESLDELATASGLALLTYRLSEWDKADFRTTWNIPWSDPELQQRYNALPDKARWQITNLLLAEDSPMLWFYLQRADCPYPVRSEAEMTKAFLDLRFGSANTQQRCFFLSGDGEYKLSSAVLPDPKPPADGPWQDLSAAIVAGLTPRQALRSLGLPTEFHFANQVRTSLTTTAFPHLTAVEKQK